MAEFPGPELDDAAAAVQIGANAWSGKRKPAELCKELFTQVVQLIQIIENVCKALGLGTDGTPNGPPWPSETPPPEPDYTPDGKTAAAGGL